MIESTPAQPGKNLLPGETFEHELVGVIEADPAKGRISVEAPVGRALSGRRAGTIVDVETPRGLLRLEMLELAPAVVESAARKVA